MDSLPFSQLIFRIRRAARYAVPLTFLFLFIEFFDELHYGFNGALLPVIRNEFKLSYAQVGLLVGLPGMLNPLIEPVLMLLGDTRLRKKLILGGGFAILGALLLFARAPSFPVLLLAAVSAFPASGAFVTLSQATLMDANPARKPHMMARWALFGSIGSLLGPLLLAAGLALDWGWRRVILVFAFILLPVLVGLVISRLPSSPSPHPKNYGEIGPRALASNLKEALSNRHLLRWVFLLQVSDLLLDVFVSYVALYFTDVTGATPALASLALSWLLLSGLTADVLLIPILERFPGKKVVRTSAAFAIGIYAGWLLVPWIWAKFILLVAIRFATLGWYPVLQAEAYAALPGRSGAVSAVASLGGLLGSGMAWLVGWTAGQAGLPFAMWLLLIGPISLVLFVRPDARSSSASADPRQP